MDSFKVPQWLSELLITITEEYGLKQFITLEAYSL